MLQKLSYGQVMGDAAKAVRLNPKRSTNLTYELTDSWETKKFSIPATKLGKGMFTTAYLGEDGMVYLVTIEDSRVKSTELSKAMIAEMNRYNGPQPHIPILEHVGSKDVRKGGQIVYAEVYKSPLYKAPLRKADSAKAWALYKELKKAIDYAWDKIPWKDRGCYDAPYQRQYVMDYFEDAKPPKGVTKQEFEDFVEAINDLGNESGNYGELAFEASPRNLATDANGQLILLDVMYDRKAAVLTHGGRC